MKRSSLVASVLLLVLSSWHDVRPGPRAARGGVWSFEGSLADRSGRGNDAFAAAAAFVPGHSGQGLRCGQGPAVVPDSPELRPAPGLRIECWVKLDALGPSWQTLLIKERAYQLRVDPPQEGGRFSFFLHLDGWEPRVRSHDAGQSRRVVSPHRRLGRKGDLARRRRPADQRAAVRHARRRRANRWNWDRSRACSTRCGSRTPPPRRPASPSGSSRAISATRPATGTTCRERRSSSCPSRADRRCESGSRRSPGSEPSRLAACPRIPHRLLRLF